MVWVKRFLILCALTLAAFVPASAQAPKRVALVIANGAYANAGQLANPPNDARLVAAALRQAGFSTVDLRPDLKVADFRTALREFRAKASGAQVALVYYAGHGIEANGRNWLIPVDAQLNSDLDLPDEAIDLDRVMDDVRGADLRVVILDACRNNPFGRSWRSGSRAVNRGLGGVDADDVLVIYAAAPGQTASDGTGANSPFATALAKRLPQPDLAIQLLGGAVRDDVLGATGGGQRPFVSASITGTPFYLVPRSGVSDSELERLRRENEALRAQRVTPPVSPASSRPTVANPLTSGRQDAGGTMAAGSVFRDCADCPEMVSIPAGRFTMGDGSSDQSDEKPAHSVSVSAFAAGKYEVTLGEWKAFVNATNRPVPTDKPWNAPGFSQDDRHPVVRVSWQDAQAYALWLSQKTGKTYRLLTEAEWEYAARAGTSSSYWFGSSASPRNANYSESGNSGTARVGTYPANAFGLFDTAGNVWEWVEDCYAENYSGAPADGSAFVNQSCSDRVLRGGSWSDIPQGLRSAIRGRNDPTVRYYDVGFRLARTL